jgi:hypothetical protein
VLAVCSQAPPGAAVVRTRGGQSEARDGQKEIGGQAATTGQSTQTKKGETADALAEAGRA